MTTRPPHIRDTALDAVLTNLRLVADRPTTSSELLAQAHPDVVRATKLAEQAGEVARIATKLAKDLRMAARVAYSKELRRRATAEEVEAQAPGLIAAMRKSVRP